MQVKQVEDYPVDLYYLMDLSYSMKDDLQRLTTLGNKLAEAMGRTTSKLRIGFGAFVDKTRSPYMYTYPAEAVENPCMGYVRRQKGFCHGDLVPKNGFRDFNGFVFFVLFFSPPHFASAIDGAQNSHSVPSAVRIQARAVADGAGVSFLRGSGQTAGVQKQRRPRGRLRRHHAGRGLQGNGVGGGGGAQDPSRALPEQSDKHRDLSCVSTWHRQDRIGWRPDASHLLVFTTDAKTHIALDGRISGIVQPNDGECHLDSDNVYNKSSILVKDNKCFVLR